MVNLQDWAICERVQRGMSSRSFDHGWYAPMEDPSLDIRRWWTAKMGAERAGYTSQFASHDGSVNAGRARRNGVRSQPGFSSVARAASVRPNQATNL